jgi:hypothetical protein
MPRFRACLCPDDRLVAPVGKGVVSAADMQQGRI